MRTTPKKVQLTWAEVFPSGRGAPHPVSQSELDSTFSITSSQFPRCRIIIIFPPIRPSHRPTLRAGG
ncbi:soluble scavenger receptor cysteine-rich domain-containing protein SSC5D-like protein [Lates japonicus]|uniref:Soluble scavenger receptor cysteine-rich domain-containing protein SSC5D-like protein n=1 Tax=Lates japonicus TaxID=270547 RepID=A0AAD3M529_LATJO|nr:soluble scavenger receptor cysteine-rich domain-containing protein SSC5D-like protein [Lates japonicus]